MFAFPKQKLVFGPRQVVARIAQDQTISPQITLWNQQGSQVIWGTLMVIPIEESLIYVRPLYLRASGGRIPELTRVIVAYQNQIVMEPTLEAGLARIFGGERRGRRPAIRATPAPAARRRPAADRRERASGGAGRGDRPGSMRWPRRRSATTRGPSRRSGPATGPATARRSASWAPRSTACGLASVRYRLTIEYAGTKYSGWQIQQNARTVQGELQRAAAQAFGKPVEIQGSGRTDAGVHALGQVAHLDAPGDLPPETLRRRINDELPVRYQRADRSSRRTPRFHARHDAVARSYIYQIARRRTAFAKPFVWWVKDDAGRRAHARRGARLFVGFHDFRSFTDDDPDQKSTQVQVDGLEIFEDEDLLVVHMEGSHFLWKMVRRIVGVLVEVGRGAHAARRRRAPAPRAVAGGGEAAPRRRRACFSNACSIPTIRATRRCAPRSGSGRAN